jgi:hypothetical protein
MEDYSLSATVLDITIHRKDEDSLSELYVDIGEQTQDFGPGDLTDLFAQPVTALGNQILPQPFHHLDPFRSFRELAFGRRQDAFQAYDNEIAGDKRTDFIRASAQKLLFEFDDGIAYRAFHTFFLYDYRIA